MKPWTDSQKAIYTNLNGTDKSAAEIAEAVGVTVSAIYNKRNADKIKSDPLNKPVKPVSEPTLPETVDPDSTSAVGETIEDEPVSGDEVGLNDNACNKCVFETKSLYIEPCKLCYRNSHFKPKSIPAVNTKIRDLCETPDPKPKPDYTESLLETLREAIEFRDAVYFCEPIQAEPKPVTPVKVRTVFDEAHRVLWDMESMARKNSVATDIIRLNICGDRITAEAAKYGEYDNVSINKKYQPAAGTAD